jgi:hypothetical protein
MQLGSSNASKDKDITAYLSGRNGMANDTQKTLENE